MSAVITSSPGGAACSRRRRSRLILGLLALGLLAGVALTGGPGAGGGRADPSVDVPSPSVAAIGPDDDALPSWDRKMGVVNRFAVLTNWSSAAVLDKETGLVWERSPYRLSRNTG